MSKEIYEKKFVKITNSNGICWYSNKINEMFYVIDKEKETNISCRYNVISNDDSMAGNGIYEHDCEEISLKQLIQRNHTECTTREDITYIVVGDSMYNNKGEYLKLQPYSDDLKDETNTNFDIIKITYKDEVLWERQEKKRIEMPFIECIKEFTSQADLKYYLESDYNGVIYKYYDSCKLVSQDGNSVDGKEILNAKWFLCER